jgi:uncharacterized protein (DUF1684 family)
MCAAANVSKAQDYNKEIYAHREQCRKDFITEERSPLKVEEIKYLQYYEPDESYKVIADFSKTENAKAFDIPTMNGKTKEYIEYGKLKFKLQNREFILTVYQGIKLLENPETADYLFVPFTDSTNGNETYINGRYLEYHIGDIKDSKLVIDFNLAYNPFCAYSDGYNCPRPPMENALAIAIRAGEKDFGLKRH